MIDINSLKGTNENKKARTEDVATVSVTNEEDNNSDFGSYDDDDDDDDNIIEDLDDSQLFQDAVEDTSSKTQQPANSKPPPENIMVGGFTHPSKKTTPLKSSAKAKMLSTFTSSNKKSTPGSKKKTAMGYKDYLASKMSNVSITKAEEGVSRITSGTGTSCLVLPTLKWVYTTIRRIIKRFMFTYHLHSTKKIFKISTWFKEIRDLMFILCRAGFS